MQNLNQIKNFLKYYAQKNIKWDKVLILLYKEFDNKLLNNNINQIRREYYFQYDIIQEFKMRYNRV